MSELVKDCLLCVSLLCVRLNGTLFSRVSSDGRWVQPNTATIEPRPAEVFNFLGWKNNNLVYGT